jgi:hypothetical protein
VLWKRTSFLYRSRWKQHFLTALPPAIFSTLIYVGGNMLLLELYRRARPSDPNHMLLIGVLNLITIRLPEFCLPWILTTIAYAAVSSNIITTGSLAERAIYDSYSPARERIGPLTRGDSSPSQRCLRVMRFS